MNHPHIAAIYGVEEFNGINALVMELVDGATLADRIAAGPIPIDDASNARLRAGVPRVLFESKNGEYDRTVPDRAWDAAADGQRLLLVRNERAAPSR